MPDPLEVSVSSSPSQGPAKLPGLQSNVPLPPKLDMKTNLSQGWKRWRQVWDSFEIVSMLDTQAMKYRVATFITCIGPDALEVYNGLPFECDSDKQDLPKILDLMEKYCIGQTNVIYERYVFNTRNQEEGESIDTYNTALRTLAQTCNFGDLKDELIRDRIVCGIRENTVRKRLLQESGLTLKKCMDIARGAESAAAKVKAMGNEEQIHGVKQKKFQPKPKRGQSRSRKFIDCHYCGQRHEQDRNKCDAYGKTCERCGLKNHVASTCRTSDARLKKTIHQLDEQEYEWSDEDILTVTDGDHINSIQRSEYQSKIFAKMDLAGNRINFQVDCGATCNILPDKLLPVDQSLHQHEHVLTMYNGSTMTAKGKCQLELLNPKNNKTYRAEFIVVKGNATPLLGSKAAQQMQLLKVQYENILAVTQPHIDLDNQNSENGKPVIKTDLTMANIKQEFGDVLKGTGHMEGKIHLQVDPSVKPVKLPIRKVPVALKPQLQEELHRLQNLGIIAPVDRPTDWMSSLVLVKKASGKLRVCLDPKPLNRALKRSNYPLPVMEDLLPELSEAKVFTLCDVKDGFWNLELDDESSLLTTFGTPFGRYRWLRLPFGISPAPELFQRSLDQALESLPGVHTIADDILVVGKNTADHDAKLLALLHRCREKGIKLNVEKMKLKYTELPYIGHLLTDTGLKPDPSKIEAIIKMDKPVDIQGVQRFCGMVNYLSKFLENLSDMCEPLRQLTHKDVEWQWTEVQDDAFEQIKKAVSEVPVLKYFDSKAETTLQCDASDMGLGASLMQNGQPVAYASRALSSTERNYAQIEKELLAIVFGMERFHQFTYGRPILVHSDHKPLETIFKKPLLSAPKRLQRMLMRLQVYDIDLVYKQGKHLYVADTLSRAYLKTTGKPDTKVEVLQVDSNTHGNIFEEIKQINMLEYLPISQPGLQKIQQETASDESLQALIKVIQHGWPETKDQTPLQARPYFHVRDELAHQDGVVMRGSRCIIPKSMRFDMMQRIHCAHLGIEGCLRRARESVYWPNMNAEVKDFIEKCETCNKYEMGQQKETLHSHEVPSRPWQKVGTDLFSFEDKEYLVTVDYYSNFWEVDYLANSTSSMAVIKKLKAHFARFGIPDQVVSDNGRQYSSSEFAAFAKEWEFEHVTSSPGHPNSNGKAEAAVKQAKSLLRKAKDSNNDAYLALLAYRNTPSQGINSSPAQRLLNRRIKSRLPTAEHLLLPRTAEQLEAEAKKLQCNQEKQKHNYDKTAKDLPELQRGDTVRIKPLVKGQREWKKAVVTKCLGRRSYEVRTDRGTYRRNRAHLRKTKESPPPQEASPEWVPAPGADTKESVGQQNHRGLTMLTSPSREAIGDSGPISPGPDDMQDPVMQPVTTRYGRMVSKPDRYGYE